MMRESVLEEQMNREYPKPTAEFTDMVKQKISEQIGNEKAERIFYSQEKKANNRVGSLLKWVAVASIAFICGTTAVASTNPLFKNYLLNHMRIEEVEKFMQSVSPLAKGQTREDKPELGQRLNAPLWEITNAWYDGVTLYFSATPAADIDDKYGIYPSDHCTINGQDCLLQCPNAESGEGDVPEGEKTGQYYFEVDLGGKKVSGDIDVSFMLLIQDRKNETLVGKQEIKFQAEERVSGVKIVKQGCETIELAEGKVDILEFQLAPSAVHIKFQYTFYGADALGKLEQLTGGAAAGGYYVEDSSGVRVDGEYPVISENQNIAEKNGEYSKIIEWETEGVNEDTDSVTFIPYTFDVDEDGKGIPGTERILDWAAFTVPVQKVQ